MIEFNDKTKKYMNIGGIILKYKRNLMLYILQ